MAATKVNKNHLRRARKKKEKLEKSEQDAVAPLTVENDADIVAKQIESEKAPAAKPDLKSDANDDDDDPTEGPSEPVGGDNPNLDFDDPAFSQFKDIFQKFGASLGENGIDESENTDKGTVFFDQDDDIPSEDEEASGQTKLSKKKRKLMNKLSVAELKALVRVPEVVEWNDVSSSDPRLLVQIKAQRNVVPVPGHWSLKREYLSSKRGIEKPAFRLPKFIAETGISEMRDAVLEKQDQQTLKQKQRERVAPKMGRLDIDYQKLYDAFFRFQTKPELTRFGEVYYEGKESEVDFKNFRPGELSDATKEALGMPPGAPPPWLINQQRFGPPPSYPTLKIPGLNAPPPPGGSWGYHAGGWGKPPVDEFNRPLYGGDVFGLTAPNGAPVQAQAAPQFSTGELVERVLWGELQPREEESEEEESEEEEEDEDEEDEDNEAAVGHDVPGGLETPAGYTSTVPTDYPGHGVETSVAGEMDLRKTRRGFDTEESTHPRAAYTVLQEKQGRSEGFFGSERTYDIKGANAHMPVLGQDDDTRKRKKPGDIDVAIDLDSLQRNNGLNKDELQRKFEEGKRETGIGAQWTASNDEDLTEMIAQESRKRQKMDEKNRDKKKEGKFKF